MTTPGGPPCDLCGQELAVISVMQFTTFDQLVVGPNCLLPWVKGLYGQLTGQQIDGEPATGDQDAVPPDGGPEAAQGAPEPPGDGPAPAAAGQKRASRGAT